jgi:hypothetical protein
LLLFIVLAGISAIVATSCGGGAAGLPSQPTDYATTTTVTAATPTPTEGASDEFTASVAAAGSASVPSGYVLFSVDGAASGSSVALSGGTAQFTTSFSTPGSHTVAAAYSGDSTHESSTSSPYSVQVGALGATPPGQYVVTITGTSGNLSNTTSVTLVVQ